MSFADRYSASVNASNLMDDVRHHSAEALMASAFADVTGTGLAALLMRVKFSDGVAHKSFESGARNLPELLKAWRAEVRKKGIERRWLPVPRTAWDADANEAFYTKVAELSLAHWIDGKCEPCGGTGVTDHKHACQSCGSTGKAAVTGERLVVQRTLDMVSDLEGLVGSHGARAAVKLRRVE